MSDCARWCQSFENLITFNASVCIELLYEYLYWNSHNGLIILTCGFDPFMLMKIKRWTPNINTIVDSKKYLPRHLICSYDRFRLIRCLYKEFVQLSVSIISPGGRTVTTGPESPIKEPCEGHLQILQNTSCDH